MVVPFIYFYHSIFEVSISSQPHPQRAFAFTPAAQRYFYPFYSSACYPALIIPHNINIKRTLRYLVNLTLTNSSFRLYPSLRILPYPKRIPFFLRRKTFASYPGSRFMNVLVYTGPGTARGPIDHTLLTLRTHLSSSYDIIPVDAPTLAREPWQQTTSLLVIPGGRDVPYVSHLSPDATTKIRAWVENGGKYLGICAGAYFACDRVEFELGRAGYEVTGDRPLKFLPGVGKGSVVEGFEYGMEEVGKAVEIELNVAELGWTQDSSSHARVYVNGGPYFHLNEGSPFSTTSQHSTKILARYSDPSLPAQSQPAIVECQVSKGLAILTGPHIEYQLALLSSHSSDPNVARLLPSLQQSAPTQQKLIRSLLQRFGLRLNDEKEGESVVQDTLDPVVSTLHLCGGSDAGTVSVYTLLRAVQQRAQSLDQVITLDDSVNVLHIVPSDSLSSVTNIPAPTSPDDPSYKQPITIRTYAYPSLPQLSETPKFNISRYFEELLAERTKLGLSQDGEGSPGFGTPLLYGEMMGSTQTLLEK